MLIWPVDLRMYRRWSQKCGSAVERMQRCTLQSLKHINVLSAWLPRDVAHRGRTIDFAETHKITPEEKHTGYGLFSNYGAKARRTADGFSA